MSRYHKLDSLDRAEHAVLRAIHDLEADGELSYSAADRLVEVFGAFNAEVQKLRRRFEMATRLN